MNNYPFFEPVGQAMVNTSRYKEIEHIIKMCDAISRFNNQSVYLIDYVQQTFLYVSYHPLFLCGYSAEEVMKMGSFFYENVLSADDFQMLVKINRMWRKFFYDTAPEERLYSSISYDFYLQHTNGAKILVNQKISPLLLDENNNMWVGICIVNLSPREKTGNVVFIQKDENLNYTYDFEGKRIIS